MSTTALISLAQYEIMMETGVFAGTHRQRVELIRGAICEMNPIGNEHNLIVGQLTDWCYDHWERGPFMIRVQSPLLLPGGNSVSEPDIAIVTRKRYTRHPLPEDVYLLVEVADSSVTIDLGEKRALYAEAGIEDYWVVNIPSRVIHVYRSPHAECYREVATFRGEEPIIPLRHPAAGSTAVEATAAGIFAILE